MDASLQGACMWSAHGDMLVKYFQVLAHGGKHMERRLSRLWRPVFVCKLLVEVVPSRLGSCDSPLCVCAEILCNDSLNIALHG